MLSGSVQEITGTRQVGVRAFDRLRKSQTLAGGTHSPSVADFGLDHDDVRHEIDPRWGKCKVIDGKHDASLALRYPGLVVGRFRRIRRLVLQTRDVRGRRKQQRTIADNLFHQQVGQLCVGSVSFADGVQEPEAQQQRQQTGQQAGSSGDRGSEQGIPVTVSGDLAAFAFQRVPLPADFRLVGLQLTLSLEQLRRAWASASTSRLAPSATCCCSWAICWFCSACRAVDSRAISTSRVSAGSWQPSSSSKGRPRGTAHPVFRMRVSPTFQDLGRQELQGRRRRISRTRATTSTMASRELDSTMAWVMGFLS